MALREERLVENQKRFRRANNRLHDQVAPLVRDQQRVPFLCECADDDCVASVELTLEEYSQVRGEASHFFIVPGHRTIEGEDVVTDNGRFAVVEKSAA
jgi:hypothetical protein